MGIISQSYNEHLWSTALAYLVDEEYTWDKLGDALVDISADHFVDLLSQLICDLGLFRFHELTHHAHDVLSTLWPRVRYIEVMQRHVLDYLFLLMNLTLGYGHILLSL